MKSIPFAIILLFLSLPVLSQNNNSGTTPTPKLLVGYWDLVDNRSYDALPEVVDEINLVTIAEQEPGNLPALIAYDKQALIQANAAGKKNFVALSWVAFQPGGFLWSTYASRIGQFFATCRPYMANTVAVLLLDEPYETAKLSHIPIATMEAALAMVAQVVRSYLPGVKIGLNVQGDTITSGYDLSFADWVGFDNYQQPFNLATMNSLQAQLERELDIPASGKRTMCVPFAYAGTTPNTATIADLLAEQVAYEAFVKAHPSIVAVIAFLYNSQPGLVGLDVMPTVHAPYREWYQGAIQ
jgi:hypothetical protein